MQRDLADKIREALWEGDPELQSLYLRDAVAHILATLVDSGLMTKADCNRLCPKRLDLEDV